MLAWRNMQEDFYIILPSRNKILELWEFKRFKHNFHDGLCLHFVCAQVTTPLSNGLRSELRVKRTLRGIKVLLPLYAKENCFKKEY